MTKGTRGDDKRMIGVPLADCAEDALKNRLFGGPVLEDP